MGFVIINGEPVHTSFLNPAPAEEAKVQVSHTGDGSAILGIDPNVAYEVYPNGDLVVILKEGDVTVFREFSKSDLAFPSPVNESTA